jgi:peptidoglycan hydrolase-like protein with peptidoglycan-binding domain
MVTRPALSAALLCLLFALGGFAATTPKAAAKKPVAGKTVAGKTVAGKTVAVAAKKKGPARRSSARTVRYTKRYAAPAAPSNERIRLVQQALIERGYLTGDANGVWNTASVEALKRLEAAENVKVDGKLDSKMLIVLGLGPKYPSALNLPGGVVTSVAADDEKQDSARTNN